MPVLTVAGVVVARLTKGRKQKTRKEYLGSKNLHAIRHSLGVSESVAREIAAKRRGKRPKKAKSVGLVRKPKLAGRMRTYQLYALKLSNDKYYIGMTAYQDVNVRFKQHMSGIRGAKWTKLHKPLHVIETRKIGYMSESAAAGLETTMTVEYMTKYGTRAVRGGDMCQISEYLVSQRFSRHTKS